MKGGSQSSYTVDRQVYQRNVTNGSVFGGVFLNQERKGIIYHLRSSFEFEHVFEQE